MIPPRIDEHAAERALFHKMAEDTAIDTRLWIPDQPWFGYTNSRTSDYWAGWLAKVKSGWIKMTDRRPEPGALIVKRWRSGSVWAGVYSGADKESSFDEWCTLPTDGAPAVSPVPQQQRDEVVP